MLSKISLIALVSAADVATETTPAVVEIQSAAEAAAAAATDEVRVVEAETAVARQRIYADAVSAERGMEDQAGRVIRDAQRTAERMVYNVDMSTRDKRQEMMQDIETVIKARMGSLLQPVHTYFQDVVDMLPDPKSCDIDAWVSCWMQEPAWKRRSMAQGGYLENTGIWDFLPAYSANTKCAKQSGCAREEGSTANGSLRVQGQALRDLQRNVSMTGNDVFNVLNKYRNEAQDVLQRGSEQYIMQARDELLKSGCSEDCINRLRRPEDYVRLLEGQCQCGRNFLPQQFEDVTADWKNYQLVDWLNGHEQHLEAIENSEYLTQMMQQDIDAAAQAFVQM